MRLAGSAVLGTATSALARFALGLAIAVFAVAVEWALWSSIPPTPFLLVYPAVVIAAWLGGWEAGVAAILVATLALIYWLLPPIASFAVVTSRDALDLALFCGVSLVVVGLMARMKRALREAQAARTVAEQATAAKDTVLAVVAHDLRNPLQTIGLSAELLSSGAGEPDERTKTLLARIARASERARRLVDNILDSARMGAAPFPVETSVWSLGSVIDESLSPFKALADARSIELEPPSLDTLRGPIVCDRDRIVQVLSNLLSNAIQFTPLGGKVAVDVSRVDEGVRFEVADTGIGMTKEDLACAFDRLWHGHGPGHGSGLGLWIARALVQAHGGHIEATSEPGKGTKMVFVVPQPSGVRDDSRGTATVEGHLHPAAGPASAPVGAR